MLQSAKSEIQDSYFSICYEINDCVGQIKEYSEVPYIMLQSLCTGNNNDWLNKSGSQGTESQFL